MLILLVLLAGWLCHRHPKHEDGSCRNSCWDVRLLSSGSCVRCEDPDLFSFPAPFSETGAPVDEVVPTCNAKVGPDEDESSWPELRFDGWGSSKWAD